jgi:hypothetical protein
MALLKGGSDIEFVHGDLNIHRILGGRRPTAGGEDKNGLLRAAWVLSPIRKLTRR